MTDPAYLRPISDAAFGGWRNELDAVLNLFESINEETSSDTDYVRSSVNPVADVCRFKLEVPPVAVNSPFAVNYRYWKDGTAGNVDLAVRLKQESTVIASATNLNISATHTDGVMTLTAEEFDSITDFDALYVEFEANVAV